MSYRLDNLSVEERCQSLERELFQIKNRAEKLQNQLNSVNLLKLNKEILVYIVHLLLILAFIFFVYCCITRPFDSKLIEDINHDSIQGDFHLKYFN